MLFRSTEGSSVPYTTHFRSKYPLGFPSSGAWQSVLTSVPFNVCPTVIGVAAKPLHPSAVAVKFRLAGAWKSSDGGLKTYPDRLGVARYTVAAVNPVWLEGHKSELQTHTGLARRPPP